MDRDTAKSLMKHCMEINAALNASTHSIEDLPDHEERARLRKHLSKIGQLVFLELMRPIVKQYPDLDPDRDTNP
jgi:hypothetical protein